MNLQPRDDNGWRIPREGTKSAEIYRLAREGKKASVIATELGMNRLTVGVLLFKMRNPGASNARSLNEYYHYRGASK